MDPARKAGGADGDVVAAVEQGTPDKIVVRDGFDAAIVAEASNGEHTPFIPLEAGIDSGQ